MSQRNDEKIAIPARDGTLAIASVWVKQTMD